MNEPTTRRRGSKPSRRYTFLFVLALACRALCPAHAYQEAPMLAERVAAGELPPTGSGLTITDYTGTGTGGTNHGTNVAEIVHDMAPGAELYAHAAISPLAEKPP